MNRMAALEIADCEPEVATAEIEIAGQQAVCDPLGVLYLPDLAMLVVSDLHLEKGAAFARRGMLLPPYDTAATLMLLQTAIARYRPKAIVSLGDSFHDRAGSAHLPAEYRTAIETLARGRDWIWITGNHDPEAPVELPGVSATELACGPLAFRHEPLAGRAHGEIAGHLHPCARVVRRSKSVRRPCFACDEDRLVMPSFGVMTGGLDLDHPALRHLFDRSRLAAHMLGKNRIYSVPHARLRGR